jgi:hypothetical protein
VGTEIDITVVLEQPRKITTLRFQIAEAETAQLLAEGTARVLPNPSPISC